MSTEPPSEPTDVVNLVAEVVHETIRGYRNTMRAQMPHRAQQEFEPIEPWAETTEGRREASRTLVRYIIEDTGRTLRYVCEQASSEYADVALIGIAAAEHALAAMGLSIEPEPECDRTGVGSVQ